MATQASTQLPSLRTSPPNALPVFPLASYNLRNPSQRDALQALGTADEAYPVCEIATVSAEYTITDSIYRLGKNV